MSGKIKEHDLRIRIVNYSVAVINISESLPRSKFTTVLCDQMIRSSTSVSLNYGEARGAESRKDFIHKLKVVLKELRETHMCLEIISRTKGLKNKDQYILQETNELISIIVASIKTASR